MPAKRPIIEEALPLVKPASKAGRFAGSDARGLVGRTLEGKYKIKAVLGEGGMGTVYEGVHVALGRAVAIKVLHPNQARKPEAVQRLYQEARSAGSIGHPNICEVYDVGRFDDGSPFLVMEKLEGETLAERVSSEGALPFDVVVDVMGQVLSGLVAAHTKGIVHRDIKPENIFVALTDEGVCCKLFDFGIAKQQFGERGEALTGSGSMVGTPSYMSPEQFADSSSVDHDADLWSFAVVAYYCLVGKRPFTGIDLVGLCANIMEGSFAPPSDVDPEVTPELDAWFARAFRATKTERFASAEEMRAAFIAALGDRGTAEPHAEEIAKTPEATASDAKRERAAGGSYSRSGVSRSGIGTRVSLASDQDNGPSGRSMTGTSATVSGAPRSVPRAFGPKAAVAATIGVIGVLAALAMRAPASPVAASNAPSPTVSSVPSPLPHPSALPQAAASVTSVDAPAASSATANAVAAPPPTAASPRAGSNAPRKSPPDDSSTRKPAGSQKLDYDHGF